MYLGRLLLTESSDYKIKLLEPLNEINNIPENITR